MDLAADAGLGGPPGEVVSPDVLEAGLAGPDRAYWETYHLKHTPCPKHYSHDWTECPFAHAGEKARRRDPRLVSGVACMEMKQSGSCALGDACPNAHNAWEYWLSPERYHTALCSNGAHCRRKRCFFAHAVHELRPLKLRSAGGAGPAPAAVAGQPAASARLSIDVSDQVQQASRLWAPRPFQQLPSSADAAAAWAGALPESAGSDAPALAAIRVPAAAGAFVQGGSSSSNGSTTWASASPHPPALGLSQPASPLGSLALPALDSSNLLNNARCSQPAEAGGLLEGLAALLRSNGGGSGGGLFPPPTARLPQNGKASLAAFGSAAAALQGAGGGEDTASLRIIRAVEEELQQGTLSLLQAASLLGALVPSQELLRHALPLQLPPQQAQQQQQCEVSWGLPSLPLGTPLSTAALGAALPPAQELSLPQQAQQGLLAVAALPDMFPVQQQPQLALRSSPVRF